MRDAIVAELRRVIGAEAVLTDNAARVAAGTDFITERGIPGAVACPASSEQVAALVGFAAEQGVELVPRGAGTNLAAGMAPTDDSLEFGPLRHESDPQRRPAVASRGGRARGDQRRSQDQSCVCRPGLRPILRPPRYRRSADTSPRTQVVRGASSTGSRSIMSSPWRSRSPT